MIKRMLLLAMGLWIGGGLLAQQSLTQRTLIYCGKLIDPKAGQVLTEMTVIVTGQYGFGRAEGLYGGRCG